MSFDYSSYGAFKRSSGAAPAGRLAALGHRLGLRNRYLKFLDDSPKDAPLLEIGCGDGSFLQALMEAGFLDVTGVEPSSTYVNVVDNKLIQRCLAHEYLATRPSGSIGTVVALDVFEHIAINDLRHLLTIVVDKLRADGKLIFRVPNMASPLALVNYFGDLSHVTPLNAASIQQLAFDSGLHVARICPEPLAYPRSPLDLLAITAWYGYSAAWRLVWRAFGIRKQIATPNLVCILCKKR